MRTQACACRSAPWGRKLRLRARSRYLAHGGMLHLCELRERDLSLLSLTRTRLLFDVHESEKDAIDAARAVP